MWDEQQSSARSVKSSEHPTKRTVLKKKTEQTRRDGKKCSTKHTGGFKICFILTSAKPPLPVWTSRLRTATAHYSQSNMHRLLHSSVSLCVERPDSKVGISHLVTWFPCLFFLRCVAPPACDLCYSLKCWSADFWVPVRFFFILTVKCFFLHL